MLVQALEVQEVRGTLGVVGVVGSPFGSANGERKGKKRGAPEIGTTRVEERAVDASAQPITTPEPVLQGRKESKKRRERDSATNHEGPTVLDSPAPQLEKKKRKKERGMGEKGEKFVVSKPSPVETMPVRADGATSPKKRKRDEDGRGKQRNEEKTAKKARKAERKLKLTVATEPDCPVALSCNVSLAYDFGTSA